MPADDEWFEQLVMETLPELGAIEDLTPELLNKAMKIHGHKLRETPPRQWPVGKLKRRPDGSFEDHDIMELIQCCIEEPAHALGAHGSPSSMKIIEVLSQLQARNTFQVCTMNE